MIINSLNQGSDDCSSKGVVAVVAEDIYMNRE